MKIYLIGSTGFIGSNLSNFYVPKNSVLLHYRQYDLTAMLEQFRPDLIINCATEIYDPNTMYDVNVGLVKECLTWLTRNRTVQFIQLGSSSEYGPVNRPTKETDPVVAYTMYAGTKGAATLLCQSYAREYKLDVQIVRPYSPYGPGDRPYRLFPALWKAFNLNRAMKLSMGVHDFWYIDDFISAIDCIVKATGIRSSGEIINVSSGQQTTNLEVLDTFRNITGIQGNVVIDTMFTTPNIWSADTSLIENKYGWKPKYTLTDGITKFLECAHYD